MSNFVNYTCWNKDRVGQVINREAVEMESASFQATHMPITGLHYATREYEVNDTAETGVLNELIRRSESDKHTFIVLKGIPGSGKSHLIRWLKERFEAHRNQANENEVVLLIRRANSSLRNTLLQIIETNVFSDPIFDSYVRRLHDASTNLNNALLANRILNGLQEGAMAVVEDSYDLPTDETFSPIIIKNAPSFLLDETVRNHLKRPGGAIERILQFLTGDNRKTNEGDEMPRFTIEDLNFSDEDRKQLSTPRTTRDLTSFLFFGLPVQRQKFVLYLNSLLNFAVSNLTTLTVDQLKNMFGELRRQLRKEGKSLTLFIEDITAFTGLDTGLIDILIAQHGADNPEYCRLTSLIGVTDSYYNQNFRENVRQRVTFLISMNGRENTDVSQFLQTSDQVQQMAVRYLNAIRLPKESISEWHAHQASIEDLPNACNTCPFRQPCHATFGSVQIDDNEENRFGLYPFNANALWTLYEHLDKQQATFTPRALLNNIVSYILISHYDKIRNGQFPPAAHELALDVAPPIMRKHTQQSLISRSTPSAVVAGRVETLVRVWGDATIDTYKKDGQIVIGTLPEQVFKTFGLPAIQEDEIRAPERVIVSTPLPLTAMVTVPIVPTPSPVRVEPIARYAEDIEKWRNGGRLQKYTHFTKDLAAWIKNAVPWEEYGISDTFVEERMKPGHFEIEGQAGEVSNSVRFILKRGDALAEVLYAIDEMGSFKNLTAAQIATNTVILHSWMTQITPDLIAYMRSMSITEETPLSYEDALTECMYGLALLAGKLDRTSSSVTTVFDALINFALSYGSDAWRSFMSDKRSSKWQETMKDLTVDADRIRYEFMVLLDCAQGRRSDKSESASVGVVYVDVARGLELVRRFKDRGFKMRPLVFPVAKTIFWETVKRIYERLAYNIDEAGSNEYETLKTYRDTVLTYLGTDTVEDVFIQLEKFTKFTGEGGIAFEFPPRPKELTAPKLTQSLESFGKLEQTEPYTTAWFLTLSRSLELKRNLEQYVVYFELLSKYLREQQHKFELQALKMAQNTQVQATHEMIQTHLSALQHLADDLLGQGIL